MTVTVTCAGARGLRGRFIKKRCQEPKQGQAYFDWLNDSLARIDENYESRNWAGVIECEDAAQDMLQDQPDELREFVTLQFANRTPKRKELVESDSMVCPLSRLSPSRCMSFDAHTI